jgi:TolB-like protein
MTSTERSNPKRTAPAAALVAIALAALVAAGCAGTKRSEVTFHDPNMDFSQIQRVAVLPFGNLTPIQPAGERVRDVFMTMMQATQSFYVVPPGEVARGLSRSRVQNPAQPTGDEVVALGKEIKVEVIFTGTVREYGEVRSGSTPANALSVSVQMIETQTGKVVWSASSTQGGVSAGDRLLGGKGVPMNEITERAVGDLLDKLFR